MIPSVGPSGSVRRTNLSVPSGDATVWISEDAQSVEVMMIRPVSRVFMVVPGTCVERLPGEEPERRNIRRKSGRCPAATSPGPGIVRTQGAEAGEQDLDHSLRPLRGYGCVSCLC